MSASNGRHGFEPQTETVQLGGWIYEIVEQPLPLIQDELGEWFGSITDSTAEASDIAGFVTAKAHALLQAFIPELMPLHEFLGYASAEALEEGGRRDPDIARWAPTGRQVRRALDAGFSVNGIDIWNDIRKLVDPTVAQTLIGDGLLRLVGTLEQQSPKPSSARTPDTDSRTSTDPPSPATGAGGDSSATEAASGSSNPQLAGAASGDSRSLESMPS